MFFFFEHYFIYFIYKFVVERSINFFFFYHSPTGLQPRGSGGEDLRMTAETCSGGDLIRITNLSSSPGSQTPLTRTQQQYDPEYAKIEAWLDEHREFAYDYFLRYYSSAGLFFVQ